MFCVMSSQTGMEATNSQKDGVLIVTVLVKTDHFAGGYYKCVISSTY